jgi:hypothetical protein
MDGVWKYVSYFSISSCFVWSNCYTIDFFGFQKTNIILINMSPNQRVLNKLQMLKLVKLKVGKALLVSAFVMWAINPSRLALKYEEKITSKDD